MMTLIFLGALITGVITFILIFHQDYEDGLIGRAALAGISVAALTTVARIAFSWFEETAFYASGTRVMLWCSLALFFARHLYRFQTWRHEGERHWRDASANATTGKRR
jgi:ABC-type transport system involved in cytochrome c biogenesis permease component